MYKLVQLLHTSYICAECFNQNNATKNGGRFLEIVLNARSSAVVD